VDSTGGLVRGVVEDIGHDPARHAPLALVRLEGGTKVFILATEGMGVGDTIAWGEGAEVRNGNTLPLAEILQGRSSAISRPSQMMAVSLSDPAESKRSSSTGRRTVSG